MKQPLLSLKIILAIFFGFLVTNAFGQAANATWALTANVSPVVTGNVNATGGTRTGVTTTANAFTGYGWGAYGWQKLNAINLGTYYEFTVSPTPGNNLNVSAFTYDGYYDFSILIKGEVYYSTDNFNTSNVKIGSTTTFYNGGTPTTINTTGLNIPVAASATVKFRIYFYYSDGTTPAYFTRVRNVKVTGTTTSAVACSGTPNPGNTIATPSNVAVGGSTSLSLQNATSGTGVTYQWQSGPASTGTWTNITGATSATYNASPTTKTWYRCIVKCSGNSGTSNPVMVSITPCIPIYTTGCTSYDKIINFVLGTISNNSGATCSTTPPGYSDYSALSTNVIQGTTYTGSIDIGNGGAAGVSIWIDYNDNSIFEPGEKVFANPGTFPSGNQDNVITVPIAATANLGAHRMRVRLVYNTIGTSIDPCTSYNYGETEDYSVNIVEAVVCEPVTASASKNVICAGDMVTLTANITAGYSYEWFKDYDPSTNTGVSIATVNSVEVSPTKTIQYRVVATKGSCTSFKDVTVAVSPVPTAIAISPNSAESCSADLVKLSVSGGIIPEVVISENFDDPANIPWDPDTVTGGIKKDADWHLGRSGVGTYSTWSSPTSPNFAVVNSDFFNNNSPGQLMTSSLVSPIFSLQDYNANIYLTFYHYYRHLDGQVAKLEISTDGGVTWSFIKQYIGTAGTATNFAAETINLNSYAGLPNLRLRFYYSATNKWYWGVDNIEIKGVPKTTDITWSPVDGLFTDPAGKNAYIAGKNATIVYAAPDATTTFTVKAKTLDGCATTQQITLINLDKKWNGSSADWSSPNNWFQNEVPTAQNCVNIPSNSNHPIILPSINALAKNLTVESGGQLTIKGNLTVTDFVKNKGSASDLVVSSDANLKQITETAINTGNITVKRESPMKKNDYTYWSSPVSGQNLYDFSTGTSTTRFYYYRESDDKFYNDTFNASTVFNPTQGYAIMAPSAYTGLQTFTGNFVGVPNNGTKKTDNTTLQFQLKLSSDVPGADKGYNLIGNPYPSNIDFDKLFTENGGSMADQNSTAGKIFRLAYFWTNVNPNRQGSTNGTGSSYSGNAYAVYNGTGGVPATSETNSPIGYTPTSIIKVGQGFIVKARPFQNNTTLIFNNTIRTTAATKFFSKGSTSEKDRYWLKLISPALDVNTILIGYVPGATNNFEWDYDAPLLSVGSDSFYSILNNETLGIQGRVYPLNPQDIVQLGTKHFEEGNYTISLGDREGIFAESQSIYLKDNLSNTVTNLSDGNYTFAAKAGVTDGRFEIIYEPKVLLGTRSNNKGELIIYREDSDFVIKSPKVMVDIEVFDISGKLIATLKPNSKHAVFETSSVLSGIYVVRIKNIHGEISTRKISK